MRAVGARVLPIAALLLSACMSKPMNPGGGGNNNGGTGGTGGGPTDPGPVATTGTISGTVTSANAGVDGARIDLGTTASATTGPSGQYTLADIVPGTHNVTLAQPRLFALGPGETSTKSTTVTTGQTSTVNWTLVQAPREPLTWVVELDPARFRPRDVTITRGDEVTWVNAQPVFHTISPDDRRQPGAWRTENMPARKGAAFSHTFDTDGTFNYSCTVHIGMTGVVRVR